MKQMILIDTDLISITTQFIKSFVYRKASFLNSFQITTTYNSLNGAYMVLPNPKRFPGLYSSC